MKNFEVSVQAEKGGVWKFAGAWRWRYQAIKHGWELMNSGEWYAAKVEDLRTGKTEWSGEVTA